jgi:type II secretory pathway predicted ATPase ExeA
MYKDFYGLRELPFELTLNPRYLFLTRHHREALSTLEYGLSSCQPVTVLIGEAGTGKTTLIGAALESELCRNVSSVHLANPTLTRNEFVEMLSARFELGPMARASKAVMLQELERELRERRDRGRATAIVIDEAQCLSDELLEEIRLLANIETPTEKLLPVVLVGQPELRSRLNAPGLRQLKQRITLRCEIQRFTPNETAGYVAQRIRTAGGDAVTLFTREAVMLIHDRSGGIPRTISVLCNNALLTGFALGRRPVDSEIVLDVAHDFDLGGLKMADAPPGVAVHDASGPRTSEDVVTRSASTDSREPPAHEERENTGAAAVEDSNASFQGYHRPKFSLFGRSWRTPQAKVR